MATDVSDWTKSIVVFPNLSAIVAQDFPDWTDGIVQVTGSVSQTQDFPDWVKTTEVDTTVPIKPPTQGGSGGFNVFGNTVTVPAPSGVASGNLLVATCVSWISFASAFSSTGWTQVYGPNTTDPNASLAVLTKTATSSEPASYTFTVTSGATANPFYCLIEAYAAVTGLDGTPGFAYANAGLVHMSAASVTPTQTGDIVLVVYFGHGTNGGATFSTPTGLFAEANAGHSRADYMQGFDASLSSTSPTPAYVSDTSDPGDYLAVTILLH